MTMPHVQPSITSSTREERTAFVEEQWKCQNHCPSCGKCHILRGKDAQTLYADYIDGKKEYIDVTKSIR